jgi:polyisoprenoid-binding protein YceI
MNRIALIFAVVVLFSNAAFAQKYMTRTGKIIFFSSTPLENIEAFNNEVSAIADAGNGDIVFQAPIKSFKFEKALMQEHFNENYMESDKYPKAEFKGRIANPSAVNFTKDGTYNVTTTGKLTIHGITRDVSVPGTITVKGNEATINSKFKVRTADYGIKIPALVEGKIAKEIAVTVNSILQRR